MVPTLRRLEGIKAGMQSVSHKKRRGLGHTICWVCAGASWPYLQRSRAVLRSFITWTNARSGEATVRVGRMPS